MKFWDEVQCRRGQGSACARSKVCGCEGGRAEEGRTGEEVRVRQKYRSSRVQTHLSVCDCIGAMLDAHMRTRAYMRVRAYETHIHAVCEHTIDQPKTHVHHTGAHA